MTSSVTFRRPYDGRLVPRLTVAKKNQQLTQSNLAVCGFRRAFALFLRTVSSL